MTALMRVGDEASVRALMPYLRSEDAGQRSAATEALQSLPKAVAPFMAALLGDADADVRLLATELARNMPPKDATRVLCGCWRRVPSQCLRRRRRGARRGRNPRCRAGVEGLRRAVRGHAVPAVRHINHHRTDFEHRKLIPDGASRSSGRTRRPRYAGRRPAPLRISLSPDRHVVRRQQALFIDRRLAERIAATGSGSFQSYFAMLRSDADTRSSIWSTPSR